MSEESFQKTILAQWEAVIKGIADKEQQIADLKALCVRAADALEIAKAQNSLVYNELIAELRKAAQ